VHLCLLVRVLIIIITIIAENFYLVKMHMMQSEAQLCSDRLDWRSEYMASVTDRLRYRMMRY